MSHLARVEGIEGLYARPRKDGRKTYYIRVKRTIIENGSPKERDERVCLGGNLERAVRRATQERERVHAEIRGDAPKREISLAEYAAWYEQHVTVERRLACAQGVIVPTIRSFVALTGDRPMAGLTRLDVQKYLDSRARTVKPSTLNGIRRDLRRFFEVAVDRGQRVDNPVARIKPVRVPARAVRVPTVDELGRLFAYLRSRKPWLYPVVVVMTRTGCRTSEATGLPWSGVDFQGKYLRLRRSKVNDEHVIPMDGEVYDLLWGMWTAAGMPTTGPVFSGPAGVVLDKNVVYRHLVRAARAVEIPWFIPRTCRQNAATVTMALAGPRAAQALMGHSSIATTMRYVGNELEARQRAVEALGGVLDRASGTRSGTQPEPGGIPAYAKIEKG